MPIVVNVDVMLARRKMRLARRPRRHHWAESIGVEDGQGQSIPFSTLEKLCKVLDCQPGDLLAFENSAPDAAAADDSSRQRAARGGE